MDKLAKLTTDIGKLWETYSGAYFTGIRNTLVLAVVATLIGCVIGLLCGILNTIPYTRQDPPVKRFFLKLLRAVIRIYVEVFRGTPMVLQAVFIFYGLPYFTDGAVAFKGMGGIWVAAIIVVSINTGAYMAESVRGGIISIDPGQTEGAKAIGMTHVQTMVNVIMPQALRNIIPQIGNNFIINIKDTSVLNVIGVTPGIYNDTVSITKANADVYNPEFIAAMQQALINVINTPEGQEIFSVYSHTGYAIAKDSDYDGARNALKVVS